LERLSVYQVLIIKLMTCTIETHLNIQIKCCIVDGLSVFIKRETHGEGTQLLKIVRRE